MLQQLHPHLTGASRPAGILLHQHEVGVVAVQGVDRAVGQVLRLVRHRLIHLWNGKWGQCDAAARRRRKSADASDLGGEQRLPVVDGAPGRDADGHHTDFGGGAGQGVIPHRLAQVFGDPEAKAVGQNPRPCRKEEELRGSEWFPAALCKYLKD